MPKSLRNRLKKVRLSELSLVDRGGNQFSDVVVIAKRFTVPLLFEDTVALINRLAKKYNPDQPRHEAGSPDGGQWSAGGGGGGGGSGGEGSGGKGGGNRQHRQELGRSIYTFMSESEKTISLASTRWSSPKDMPLSRYDYDKKWHSAMFPDKAFNTKKEAWDHFQQEARRINTKAHAAYDAANAKDSGDPHDVAIARSSAAAERRGVERMLDDHGLDRDGAEDRADEIMRSRTRERQSPEARHASTIRGQLTRYSKGARGNPRSALASPKQMVQSALRTSKLAAGPREAHNMANPHEWARNKITEALEMYGTKYPAKVKGQLRALREFHIRANRPKGW